MADEIFEITVYKIDDWYPGYRYYAVEGDVTGDGDYIGYGDTPDEAYWDCMWALDGKFDPGQNFGYRMGKEG